MDAYKATEEAYKNGYNQGKKSAIDRIIEFLLEMKERQDKAENKI